MKHFLAAAFLITSTAHAFDQKPADFLSTTERKNIVRMIDNVCGDTWCEGDFNYRFNDFACDKTTHVCELNFQFIREEDEKSKTYSTEQICRFENIKEIAQIVESKFSLTDDFYSSVNDCINEKESQVKF